MTTQVVNTNETIPVMKRRPTSLLDLPTELWTKIVKLAVESEEPININLHHSDPVSNTEPGITAVCRKIRSETLPHYYSTNIFYCQGSSKHAPLRQQGLFRSSESKSRRGLGHLHDWLVAIGSEQVEALRTVYYVNSFPTSFGEEFIKLRGHGKVRVRPVSWEEYEQWRMDMAIPEESWDVGIGCVAKVEMA